MSIFICLYCLRKCIPILDICIRLNLNHLFYTNFTCMYEWKIFADNLFVWLNKDLFGNKNDEENLVISKYINESCINKIYSNHCNIIITARFFKIWFFFYFDINFNQFMLAFHCNVCHWMLKNDNGRNCKIGSFLRLNF